MWYQPGGHPSDDFRDLPHDLPLHSGWSGCVLEVTGQSGGGRGVGGRGVGQCGVTQCTAKSCNAPRGVCIHSPATYGYVRWCEADFGSYVLLSRFCYNVIWTLLFTSNSLEDIYVNILRMHKSLLFRLNYYISYSVKKLRNIAKKKSLY